MIRYLDTSALAKRYVTEPGSSAVRALFRGERIAVARIAYAELAAVIARRCREGMLATSARDTIFLRLAQDFSELEVMEIRAAIIARVPGLVVRHPLRAFDAVQLAAAIALRDQGAAVDFWCADRTLSAAARAEGLKATLISR